MQSKQRVTFVAVLVVAYWLFSGGLTLYNKWLFTPYGFHFPVFLIICTTSFNSAVSFVLRHGRNRMHGSLAKRLRWPVFFRFLVPIGVATGLEIATSNLSLLYLSVSFHTMIQASKPAFVLLWVILLRLQPFKWSLFGIVMLIAVGISLVSVSGAEEASDNSHNRTLLFERPSHRTLASTDAFTFHGLFLVLFSCFCSGIRLALMQMLLKNFSEKQLWSNLDQVVLHNSPARGAVGNGPGDARVIDEAPKRLGTNKYVNLPNSASSGEFASAEASAYTTIELDASAEPVPATLRARESNGEIELQPLDPTATRENVLVEEPDVVRHAGRHKRKSGGHLSPILLMYYVSPVIAVSLVPVFLIVEYSKFVEYVGENQEHIALLSGLILVCGLLALALTLIEFVFIKTTSSLTLSIAAIYKELLLVATATLVNGDKITFLSFFGFVLCLVATGFYNSVRRGRSSKKHRRRASNAEQGRRTSESSSAAAPSERMVIA